MLVTGGGTGIGRACALALARAGASAVAVNYSVSKADADATVAAIEALPAPARARALAVQADVAVEADVLAMVAAVVAAFGRLDVLVNNAGYTKFTPHADLDALTDAVWDRTLAVNLKGTWYCTRAAAAVMRRPGHGGGSIVNVTSIAGILGAGSSVAYCASKGAVLAFTRNLAQQVGADGITVNAVCPGRIATEMSGAVSPAENQKFIDKSIIKRLGAPEDIAFAVTYLASPRASFVTAETMNVNGGTLRD